MFRAALTWLPAVGLALLALTCMCSAAPNLIMLSIDDGVTDGAIDTAYLDTVVASGARNANGCRPPITWFSDDRSDCSAVLEAQALGHELATHTLNHPKNGEDLSYDEWMSEVSGQIEWLKGCGIPAEDIKGFRAPYYETSPTLGQVLQDVGLTYDSSLTGDDSPAAPMNQNFPYSCGSECSGWDELSIWEVPAYALPGSGKRSDPEPSGGKSVLERLQDDFERKRGTGVPTSIMVHEDYLNDDSNRGDIVAFLQWALSQDDTYAITYAQYIDYLQSGSINQGGCDTSGSDDDGSDGGDDDGTTDDDGTMDDGATDDDGMDDGATDDDGMDNGTTDYDGMADGNSDDDGDGDGATDDDGTDN